jgi:tRNA(Ile)-lysidine synthase
MAPPAVAAVLQKVTATVREHGMVEPGQRVLVACSGGPDSVCLLQSLHRLRRLLRIRLVVFHFDHALRPGSSGDAAYVRRLASRLDLPVVIRRAAAAPEPGRSVEEWARAARYAALDEAAAKVGADVAALGHTLDDQAETVLLGLLRGGGLEAVGGMPPVTSLPPGGFPGVRPLIDTTREETERFCRSLGLRPRRDPTNRDRRFLRNRLRLDVLPLLERRLGRGVRASAGRSGWRWPAWPGCPARWPLGWSGAPSAWPPEGTSPDGTRKRRMWPRCSIWLGVVVADGSTCPAVCSPSGPEGIF